MKELKEKLGVGCQKGPYFPGEMCPAVKYEFLLGEERDL